MIPTIRAVRDSLLSRGMKYLVALIMLLGLVTLYLLSGASANTPMFSRDLPALLYLGVALVSGLMVVVGYQLLALRRRLRLGQFGSKLTLRLVLLFSLVAVLPGALVYAVSVQFLYKSIESWFDVRVDKALEGGLSLGRVALDSMLRDLTSKAEGLAFTIADVPAPLPVTRLNRLREQADLQEASLFRADATLLAFSTSEGASLTPAMLEPAVARKVRLQDAYRVAETTPEGGLRLRVVVAVNRLFGEVRLLQVVQPVPTRFARDANAVQSLYQDYQELSLSRQGLKRLYGLALTLSLLLALLTALVLAIVFSERLSAPLGELAAGTRAVAQGDFSQRHPVRSQDELGILTESFNTMTTQLAEARAAALRHQDELAAANAYLGSILARLSAGVLSFDTELRLRSVNPSARQILGEGLESLLQAPLAQWSGRDARLGDIATAILAEIGTGDTDAWEKQVELATEAGGKVLLLRGSRLQAGAEGGVVVVFDDITRLLQAQRYAAWGEVARRLAHEIKNPLTPIQLSAERLEHRLHDRLQPEDAEMLSRSTRTIVNQVAALKGMVDAFGEYAKVPEVKVQPLDLNRLVREVLALYESTGSAVTASLAEGLPEVLGDAARLRQVLHNLLQNAAQALTDTPDPRVLVRTVAAPGGVSLIVQDNGSGFPAEILARAFEPYVTTKQRGTGLGLAIVKRIMEEHNGRIEIRNRQPAGAEVSLLLPQAGDRLPAVNLRRVI